MKKITVIPSTIDPKTRAPFNELTKRRVAAYARVSTDTEEQLTSYEAQIDFYTNYIKANPEWEFVKIYSDEGISATSTKGRDGFNQMISDALDGKIDLIVTKSISRFARNTVDTLVAIRKLKEKGVECYFEKENIYTFDSKGELLITIMSSIAQEESRSLSQNVTWGIRKSFSDGKVRMPYKVFLGYKKGEDGRPEIVPEEAAIVRKIYYLFLNGSSIFEIVKILESEKVTAPGGGTKWHNSTVRSILTNEKYKGDALLQKSFMVDFLERRTKINEGEVPQYYVENSHDPIIPREEWDLVQALFKERFKLGRSFQGAHPFSNRFICGDCGSFYGPKVWHSNTKYRSERWQCNNRFVNRKKGIKCDTPYLTVEFIKERFIDAFNKLGTRKDKVLKHCKEFIEILDNTLELDELITKQNEQVEVLSNLAEALVMENASTPQDQDAYRLKYANLEKEFYEAKNNLNELTKEKERKVAQIASINSFIKDYKKLPNIITEWSDKVWSAVVEKVIVYENGSLKFIFKSGDELEV